MKWQLWGSSPHPCGLAPWASALDHSAKLSWSPSWHRTNPGIRSTRSRNKIGPRIVCYRGAGPIALCGAQGAFCLVVPRRASPQGVGSKLGKTENASTTGFFKTSKIWKTGPKPQVAKIGVLNHRQSRKLPSANILGRIKKTSKTQRIFRSDKIWKTRSEPKDTKKDGAKLIKVQTSGIDKFIRRSKNTRKKSWVSKLAKFGNRAEANRCKKGLLRHRQ